MYKIVYSSDGWLPSALLALEKKVNKLKDEGWKEQGGLSITYKEGTTAFCAQAMTKSEDEDCKPKLNKKDITINSLS